MQNQNRAGVDGSSGSSSTVLASAAAAASGGGQHRGSGTSGPRPPSISARHGFSEGLLALGGDGSQPVTPEMGTGSAFNLLGLPPSPAPRSGVTRAPSAWGATAGGGAAGGLRGVGDVMAGQVGIFFGGGGTLSRACRSR